MAGRKVKKLKEEESRDRGILAHESKVPVKQFDPLQNTHLWTMWRLAVNERILNETKVREQGGDREGFSASLTRAPLSQYIQVTDTTRKLAHELMFPKSVQAKGSLLTGQFIYYGIPRIIVSGGAVTAEAPVWRLEYEQQIRDQEITFQ